MMCATRPGKAGIQDSQRVALDPPRDASIAGCPSRGRANRGHMERLAMPRPFMHLQASGGPWGRRKRFRRSVAQWLEHRSPNSASAIPPHSIACHLVSIFGPKTPSQLCLRTSPFCPVPSNWFAKMLAALGGRALAFPALALSRQPRARGPSEPRPAQERPRCAPGS
jgi:hypothetical protein